MGKCSDVDFIKILKDKKHTAFTDIDCFYKSQSLGSKFSFIDTFILIHSIHLIHLLNVLVSM